MLSVEDYEKPRWCVVLIKTNARTMFSALKPETSELKHQGARADIEMMPSFAVL